MAHRPINSIKQRERQWIEDGEFIYLAPILKDFIEEEIEEDEEEIKPKINYKKRKQHPRSGIKKGYGKDFTFALKLKIKNRDGNICQNCGISPKHNSLHIHHIDYNKKNSNENNLISLCPKCHTNTNRNRDYWLELFQKKMKQRKLVKVKYNILTTDKDKLSRGKIGKMILRYVSMLKTLFTFYYINLSMFLIIIPKAFSPQLSAYNISILQT